MDIFDWGIYYCVAAGTFLLILRLCGVWVDAPDEDLPTTTTTEQLPLVSVSRGERECGRVLALLFPRHRFIKVRPQWLLNDWPGRITPPRPLELDFYCEELKLAVEFNGQQHYQVVPRFHGTGPDAAVKLTAQILRDQNKAAGCKERGVELIVVRFDVRNVERFLSEHPIVLRLRAVTRV